MEPSGFGGQRTHAPKQFRIGDKHRFRILRHPRRRSFHGRSMMIDQLGLAQETTAVPQLMEIAAGEHESLRDQFVRIKAIEALGRMHASEAAELLRNLAERREGLTYAEPAGLRAAAEMRWH